MTRPESRLTAVLIATAVAVAGVLTPISAAADELPDPVPSAEPTGSPRQADEPRAVAGGLPIEADEPGVAIANSVDDGAPLKVLLAAILSGVTESDVTTKWQWYRVGPASTTKIKNATSDTYRPVKADIPYRLMAVATVTKAGYDPLVVAGMRDVSLRLNPGTPLGFEPGVVAQGRTITANEVTWIFEDDTGTLMEFGAHDTGATYQWLRDGKPIRGAGTGNSYLITAADVGKRLSYTVRASVSAYLPSIETSPKTPKVRKQQFALEAAPVLYTPSHILTADASATDVSPQADAVSIRWYRNGKLVKTGRTYTLTSKDRGKVVEAKARYTRPGYEPLEVLAQISGSDHNGRFWISASPATPRLTADSEPKLGGTLTVAGLTYNSELDEIAIAPEVSYQWLRDGKTIPGATGTSYELQPADVGKRIQVRVTATDPEKPYLLPYVALSEKTQKIGTQLLEGWDAALGVPTIDPSSTDFSTKRVAPDHGITTPGVTVKYQWLRDGKPIKKATSRTYKLTSADRNALLSVRLTISKKASGGVSYTTVVKESMTLDATMHPLGTATFTGLMEVGGTSSVTVANHIVGGHTLEQGGLALKYRWYRNGKPISGATAPTYTHTVKDLGKKITVKVTVGLAGFVPYSFTIGHHLGLKVAKDQLVGDTDVAPTVVPASGNPLVLEAKPPAVVSDNTGTPATIKYQWYRNGKAITGATKRTYTPTSADRDKEISVRTTATLAGHDKVISPQSTPTDYSLKFGGSAEIIGDFTVGGALVVTGLTVTNSPDAPQLAYSWRRTKNGKTTIVSTGDSYVLQPGDYRARISVRITATAPNRIPVSATFRGDGDPLIGPAS